MTGLFTHLTRSHRGPGKRHPKPWTEAADAILHKEIAEGKTFAEIADILGRSRNSCIGRASRLAPGYQRTKTGPPRDVVKRDAFAEALAETGTIHAAAARLGISRQRGSQLFADIKTDIDGAQVAAGFGRWCL